jgi:hypothetical protein
MGSVRLRRAALVLGLLVAPPALQACGGGGSTKAASSSSSARTAPSSTTSSTVPKPDQTPKDAALEAPITTGSFQVVFHGVTVPYVPTNNFDKPAAGTVLVTVDTEVKNTGAAVAEFFADMFAVDKDNRVFNRVSSGVQPETPKGQLAAGTGKRGLVVFQLPDGAQGPGLRLVFMPDPEKEAAYVLPLVAGGTPPAVPSVGDSDPNKTYAKGEAARIGDWGVLVVNGVTNPAPPEDAKYDAPDAGFHLVVLDVTLFNMSKQNHLADDFDPKIKDPMNQSFSTTSKRTAANTYAQRGMQDTVPPGFGLRGPVTFMVPDASGTGPLTMLVQFHSTGTAIMFALA